jgi:nucleotide-binding universal stress UspA family protein
MTDTGNIFSLLYLSEGTVPFSHDDLRELLTKARENNSKLGITGMFLLGSVTAKVLHGSECPVWTGAHVEESPVQEFAIRNVLCAVDFGPRSHKTASWAAQMAGGFGARLTLAHVTASVEIWGPGGNYVKPEWKEALVSDASQHLAELQQDLDIKADVFIGSGDVPRALSQAAKQTKADLLVTECYPYGGNLRIHGYAIICAVPIPVVSV